MAVAVFDPVAFAARYPEFNAVAARLPALFAEAGLYLSNTDTSPVQDIVRRGLLLQMLTAHIAYVGGLLSADGQPRPVGRVSQASEGSVSASFADIQAATPGTGEWFKQSSYGYAFWQATSSLRAMRYFPQRTRY